MKLLIDGKETEYALGTERAGLVECKLYGKSLSGRKCIVAVHTVPTSLFTHGGKVKTGGHVYEARQ